MKNIIFSIFLVLISIIGCTENAKILNGNKEEQFLTIDSSTGTLYYRNIPYTGIYEYYHENGQPELIGYYFNGKENGVWKT